MTRSPKTTPSAHPARKQVLVYVRVSSKEQEKEGFSIPAQLKLLRDYAAAQDLAVVKEYVDVETAKQIGRAGFGDMIGHLRAHPSIRALLVEKTDRLAPFENRTAPLAVMANFILADDFKRERLGKQAPSQSLPQTVNPAQPIWLDFGDSHDVRFRSSAAAVLSSCSARPDWW
jgi:hypothetical protein